MNGEVGRQGRSGGSTAAGVVVALAAVGVTVFVVVTLGGAPAVIAAVLVAFAAVLGAVAPVIRALGGGR